MEHNTQNEGRLIWKVAIATIIFTTLTSLSWHLGEMRVVHERERSALRVAREEAVRFVGYRDALASGGTTTAKVFLESKPTSKYGF